MNDLPKMTKEELRSIRDEMQLTQDEIAKRFGVALSTYKKWEYGNREIPGPAVLLSKYILQDHRKLQK